MHRNARPSFRGVYVFGQAFTGIVRNDSLCIRVLICLALYMHYYAHDAVRYEVTMLPPGITAETVESGGAGAS